MSVARRIFGFDRPSLFLDANPRARSAIEQSGDSEHFLLPWGLLKRYRLIPLCRNCATGGEWAIRFPGFPFFPADKN
jgi:hypothetical protein